MSLISFIATLYLSVQIETLRGVMVPVPKAKKSIASKHPTAVIEPDDATDELSEGGEDSGLLDIDGDAIQSRVQQLLKMSVFEPAHSYWLNTGSREMNAVFGSADLGIPYGKVIEVSGVEHCGKTLMAMILMGIGQRDGAAAGYLDFEESRDEQWATKLGVKYDAVTKFYPQLVTQKKGPPILLSAEAICEQAESAMGLLAKNGAQKQIWFLDSIAMMVTSKQYSVGLSDSSMNSKLDRAMFLSTLLPRWAGLAANYNAMIIVSNQLRSKVGGFVMGDPDETTGGKALRHVCSIRVRGRRLKGGRLRQGKNVIGLAGVFRNVKNKAGAGSCEGAECGFKILWNKPKASIEFMTVDDLKADMGEEN